MPTATNGKADIHIAASPEVVYELVADISRMGERSPECYRCEWVDGATAPTVGARFRGHNRIGFVRWSTTCTVTAADRGHEFAFSVVNRHGREETRWRYVISGDERGTTVSESYIFLWCPVAARIAELPFPRDRQLRRGIVATLTRLKAEAEAHVTAAGP